MAQVQNGSDRPFSGKMVIICGGSKGIGKETAKEIARLGGSLCIVARDADALESAAEEIRAQFVSDSQFVEIAAADATVEAEIRPPLVAFVEKHGVPAYLINAVGYAYPEYVTDLKLSDYERNMQINYFGQLVPTFVLLPYFVEAGGGHISFISSMLGYMGLVGYATYAPSKFAIVGLAETLRHELKPNGIGISILYPPDTDTPGFEIENQTKPKETAMLSETAKLYPAEQVAKQYVKGLLTGKYHIMMGEGKWIWLATRLAPRLVHKIMDNDYLKARKKLGKNN